MSKGEVGGSRMANVLKATEDLTKSPEQLADDRASKLAERIPKLNLEGKSKDALVDIVTQWFNQLKSTTFYIYDCGERGQRQKYDIAELAERGRQLERAKNKNKSKSEPTGLGGPVFTKLSEFFPQAPPKISLYSRFERVIDRRTLAERREAFNHKPGEEVVFVKKVSKFEVKDNKGGKKKKSAAKPKKGAAEPEAEAAAE